MKSQLRHIGKKLLAAVAARFGYELMPIRRQLSREVGSYGARDAYKRLQARGHIFNTVIDIGASDGRWSADFMNWFPDAEYLLIEAQALHQEALELFCTARPNTQFILAAASDRDGQIFFDASDPFGGQGSTEKTERCKVSVAATTVDGQVQARQLKGPFLLKFDTHGFELPILKGAEHTLTQTELVIMECYNFPMSNDSLLFYRMCQHMESLGFRCIDLYDPCNRVRDGAFWQMDLVFARSDRPEFSNSNYT